ncbi:COX15/CtaA family protein [Caulobacter sp. 17J65-9]|uniref:COX15/CtaA family protein n=1 Tax=Caulobacter sp. 17J65-9 TaxID=2709382 RepID=UPI0013C6487C|nr:COX15/CtaA family protein [Caulobacter sp. 17J65-9]NEX92092.1 heme A synthase [Caulobacter sp. 17J65-9]
MNRAFQHRSLAVALWLFGVAALVFAMVVVGGVTRLTDSGLSITEWKPLAGAIPPLNHAEWMKEFANYQRIPEYQQINRGMTLGEFQGIFWWEWAHRQLGRLIGLAVALPFLVLLALRKIPQRLIWRCVGLLALVGVQGAIGWWMVSSGLTDRVDVAPERLAIHLGMALLIFVLLVWTGLEALSGPERSRPPAGWARASAAILGLVYVQALLGALVAGSDAGMVYNDWPRMNGSWLPPVDWSKGPLAFLHDQALVQFNHRIGAYVVLIAVTLYAVRAFTARMPEAVKAGAVGLAVLVWGQATLGVLTLVNAVPLPLGALHQAGAVAVLAAATFGLWRILRLEERLFSPGIGSRGR